MRKKISHCQKLLARVRMLFKKKARRKKRKKVKKKGSPGHQHPKNKGYKFIHKESKNEEKLHSKGEKR